MQWLVETIEQDITTEWIKRETSARLRLVLPQISFVSSFYEISSEQCIPDASSSSSSFQFKVNGTLQDIEWTLTSRSWQEDVWNVDRVAVMNVDSVWEWSRISPFDKCVVVDIFLEKEMSSVSWRHCSRRSIDHKRVHFRRRAFRRQRAVYSFESTSIIDENHSFSAYRSILVRTRVFPSSILRMSTRTNVIFLSHPGSLPFEFLLFSPIPSRGEY